MVSTLGKFHDYICQGFKYKLFVPKTYKAKKDTPLMVMLHGCGQDPDDFAAGTKMNELADKENFLVLYPNMNHLFNPSDPAGYNPFGCWNWFLDKNQHRGQGHPKLIYEIIEEVKRGYSIDAKHVYAAGLSAGGSLACILGVTYPDVFSAIGICSGLAYDAANVFFLTDPMAEDAKKSMEKGVPDAYACGINAYAEMGEFKKKMKVIVFHGICDTTVHPINGQQVITQWAQTNYLVEGGKGNAEVTPSKINAGMINGKSYTQHLYADGSNEPLLELWMVDKMGHVWSGGSPNGSYTDPSGPNASEIMWNFFTKKQQPLNEQITQKQTETKDLDSALNVKLEESPEYKAVETVPSPDLSSQDPLVQIPDQPSVKQPIHSSELSPVEIQEPPTDLNAGNCHVYSPELLSSEMPVSASDHPLVKKPIPSDPSSVETPVADQSSIQSPITASTENRDSTPVIDDSPIQPVKESPDKPKKKLLFTLLSKLTKLKR
jgi:poly(hydroxyalkanoate) depolymerase family esterase